MKPIYSIPGIRGKKSEMMEFFSFCSAVGKHPVGIATVRKVDYHMTKTANDADKAHGC